MKTRHKFVVGGAIIFAVIAALSVQGLQEMTVFFYTPQEVLAAPRDFEEKTIRIGALVHPGTVDWDARNIRLAFHVTENSQQTIPVVYQGLKPDMFREGQGVVVEGRMHQGVFQADQLLVKHSEEYKLDHKNVQNKEDYYKSVIQ
jgi:cytochrome c-type biogenesis protein CcmE